MIGLYALNAHALAYSELPEHYARDRPRHGIIPAAYISTIGVDRRHQNRGLGSLLQIDAIGRIVEASANVGIRVVLLDVLDCGDPQRVARRKALYESYGFTALPSHPLRLYAPLERLAAHLA